MQSGVKHGDKGQLLRHGTQKHLGAVLAVSTLVDTWPTAVRHRRSLSPGCPPRSTPATCAPPRGAPNWACTDSASGCNWLDEGGSFLSFESARWPTHPSLVCDRLIDELVTESPRRVQLTMRPVREPGRTRSGHCRFPCGHAADSRWIRSGRAFDSGGRRPVLANEAASGDHCLPSPRLRARGTGRRAGDVPEVARRRRRPHRGP
jgi:hypothetical protein